MAGEAVVGTLRALLTLDTADFEKASVRASKAADKFSKDWAGFGRQAENLGRTLTTAVTLPLAGLAAGAIKASIDFEDSFAGVAKTVDGVVDQGGRLTEMGLQLQHGFRDLAKEIPVSVNELNRIGEAAGQLGIKSQNIIGFTDVMAKLGVATNLSSDQAATALARLANITQMPQAEFERLGSTVVALGNNFATTESEIVEFGLRVAGAGAQVGMTEPQILAIGTALSSLGVEAEAGGTAVQKVILMMMQSVQQGGESLETFAATAGMSAEQFQRAFRDDAGAAFTAFVNGLGKQGQSAITTLDELGLADQRLIRSFLALAGAGDLLNETMAEGTSAWRENDALQREAAIRFQTTSNQLKLLWNQLYEVGITLGGTLLPVFQDFVSLAQRFIPVIESVVHGFAALPEPLRMGVVGFGALLAAIGPVVWIAGQAVTAMTTLAGAIGAKGILAPATKLGGALVSVTGALASVAAAAGGVAAAFAIWKTQEWAMGLANVATQSVLAKVGLDDLGYSTLSLGEKFAAAGEAWKRIFTGGNLDRRDIIQSVIDQRNAVDESTQAVDRNADAWKKAYAAMGQIGERNRQATGAERERAEATRASTQATEAQADAEEAAKKATEALTAAIGAQDQALRSLGIPDVNGELDDLRGAMTAAARAGLPMESAVRAVIEKLKDLRARAIAAGVSVEEVDDQLGELRTTLRLIEKDAPRLTARVMDLSEANQILADHVGVVTSEQMRARTESSLLASAYETLGIRTSDSLRRAAEEARIAYERILASGRATEAELIAARERVEKAEIEAGLRTVSLWEEQIQPAILGVWNTIAGSLSANFTDMLTGAVGFKEGFQNIWNDLKTTVLNILDQILRSFIGSFLNGMLQGLNAWAAKAGAIFASVFNFGPGGIPVPTIGGGGIGAGTGTGVGVGVGSTAVGVGLTAASVAPLAIPWAQAALGPHGNDALATAQMEAQAFLEGAAYLGLSIEEAVQRGFADGLSVEARDILGLRQGGWGNFGEGTPAILHASEAVFPLPQGFDLATMLQSVDRHLSSAAGAGAVQVILEQDGRRAAEWIVPYIPGEVQRLALA